MNQEFVGCRDQDSSRLEYLCMLRLRLIGTRKFAGHQDRDSSRLEKFTGCRDQDYRKFVGC